NATATDRMSNKQFRVWCRVRTASPPMGLFCPTSSPAKLLSFYPGDNSGGRPAHAKAVQGPFLWSRKRQEPTEPAAGRRLPEGLRNPAALRTATGTGVPTDGAVPRNIQGSGAMVPDGKDAVFLAERSGWRKQAETPFARARRGEFGITGRGRGTR